MLDYIASWFGWKTRSEFVPLDEAPPGYFIGRSEYNLRMPGRINSTDEALALSPFFAALRLFQQSAASLPLVTYTKGPDNSRDRLADKSTFNLLHERPNPAQSRAVFMEKLLLDYWLEGEFFVHLQWSNNHRLVGMFPIPARNVLKIEFNDKWEKTYHVVGEEEPYKDGQVVHVVNFSRDGLRGVSFLRYAAESLGLHKQIQTTAAALYENSARVNGQVVQTSQTTKEARAELRADIKENFGGARNAGGLPIMPIGTKIEPLDNRTAEAVQIIEALNISCADVGRWFGLSPLIIGDLSRGTYSNSAADKLAFYQKNMLPILDKIQLELNYKLFGAGASTYCEFLNDAILRADQKTQAEVWHLGLQDGYLLKSEVRAWLNLTSIPGMDVPQTALNMGPIEGQEAQAELEQEESVEDQNPQQAV